MSDEWFWAAIVLAAPLALFLLLELYGFARSRRNRTLATRRKGPGPS